MARLLRSTDPDFETDFAALLTLKRETATDVNDSVRDILEDVRARGDAALFAYTEQFDGFTTDAQTVRVTPAECAAAEGACDPAVLAALDLAAERITDYHTRQRPQDMQYTDDTGVALGWRWTPIDAAGLYVPGGLASYPSSVLMNAIPARAQS
ncbi:MAG: histidinol dehydrogenase [Pseudomonadota bacterium]